jgi:hypothetical protein
MRAVIRGRTPRSYQVDFADFSYMRACLPSPSLRQIAASSLYTYDVGGPVAPD